MSSVTAILASVSASPIGDPESDDVVTRENGKAKARLGALVESGYLAAAMRSFYPGQVRPEDVGAVADMIATAARESVRALGFVPPEGHEVRVSSKGTGKASVYIVADRRALPSVPLKEIALAKIVSRALWNVDLSDA